MKELGVYAKLRKLLTITLKKATASIRTQKGKTEEFDKDVRQYYSPCTGYNMYYEK